MLTTIRRSLVAGAVLTALAVLLLGKGVLLAQTEATPTPSTTDTPASGAMAMDMGTPSSGAADTDMTIATPTAGAPVGGEQTITVAQPTFQETPLPPAGQNQMGQMMDNCIDMMSMMMGGGMMGMMDGMPGLMGGGMPGPMGGGMPGPMGTPMDQCMACMGTMNRNDQSALMAFSTDQCQMMLGGGAMPGM